MAVTLSIAMLGASGRMGRSIIPLVAGDSSGLRLSGALVARGDHSIGQDAGSFAGSAPLAIAITDDPRRALDGASVAIDFTVAAASIRNAALCRELGVPMVIGTTGHNGAQLTPASRALAAIASRRAGSSGPQRGSDGARATV